MNMKMGFGKECLTPPEGVELAGYGYFMERRNTGVTEDIFARAIAIELGDRKTVILNADLIGLTQNISSALEDAISKRFGIDKQFIMIACTHIHTGPNTGVLCGCGEFNTQYYNSACEKLLSAVSRAISDLKTVTNFSFNDKPYTNSFAHNRVVKGGEIDDTVRTALFNRDGASPIALINYSCHPVSYAAASKVSCDYPGILCKLYEKDGIQAIYLNGFCGNINPRERGEEGCADRAAQSLYDISSILLKNGKAEEIRDMSACGDYLPIDLLQITVDDIEKEFAKAELENIKTYSRAIGIWAYTQKYKLISDNAYTDYMQYKALRLGKLLIIFHSGETAIEFGKDLLKAFSDYHVMFVGNAFSTMRYVATEKMIGAGGYEAFSSSFAYNCMPIEPGSGERYFEKLKAQVKPIL